MLIDSVNWRLNQNDFIALKIEAGVKKSLPVAAACNRRSRATRNRRRLQVFTGKKGPCLAARLNFTSNSISYK
jgi:hypothetical protein